jgi:type IV fimbrial biogenesis protein FimT
MDVITFASRERHRAGRGKLLSSALPYTFPPCRGFTLLDLLSAMAIVVLVLGFGLPALQTTVASNRLATRLNALAGTLAYARSEAIRRNQRVVICKSDAGGRCVRRPDWREGWLVYVDANANHRQDADETVLARYGALPAGQILDYRAFGSRHYLVYRPDGVTRTNGTFTFCDPDRPELARALILTKTGRARLSRTRGDGSPLPCG